MGFAKGLLIGWFGLTIGIIVTLAGVLYRFGEADAIGVYTYPNTTMKYGKRVYRRIMK